MRTVVLDTNVFLSVINGESGGEASSRVLDLVDGGRLRGVVSTVSVAELSVGYHGVGDVRGLREFVLHVSSSPSYVVAGLDTDTAVLAGKIRSETGLRLPDSIIVASGVRHGADCIVTGDSEFGRASGFLGSSTPETFIAKGPKAKDDR